MCQVRPQEHMKTISCNAKSLIGVGVPHVEDTACSATAKQSQQLRVRLRLPGSLRGELPFLVQHHWGWTLMVHSLWRRLSKSKSACQCLPSCKSTCDPLVIMRQWTAEILWTGRAGRLCFLQLLSAICVAKAEAHRQPPLGMLIEQTQLTTECWEMRLWTFLFLQCPYFAQCECYWAGSSGWLLPFALILTKGSGGI